MTNARNLADVGRIEGLSLDNAIINGNFDIWQRGTSFTGVSPALTYSADRWSSARNGTGATVNVSRVDFALGQTDVPNNPSHYINYEVTTAGSGETYHFLGQRIESVKTFAGETVTVSFYAKASSAVSLSVGLTQHFGTGGSPSVQVVTMIDSYNLTTSFQKFTATVTVPSISGKTLGTDGNDRLLLFFDMPRDTTFDLDIAQVKLEPGSVATPFRPRPIAEELALCQRYYQVAISTLGFVAASAGEQQQHNGTMFTQMRATPTLTVLSVEISVNATRILVADGPNGWRHVISAIAAGQCGDYVVTVSLDSEV
jgi:hypothetical protein